MRFPAWDVVIPARRRRVNGVSMAGFSDRGVAGAGHRAIPHPTVTLALEFGAGPLMVEDVAGSLRWWRAPRWAYGRLT